MKTLRSYFHKGRHRQSTGRHRAPVQHQSIALRSLSGAVAAALVALLVTAFAPAPDAPQATPGVPTFIHLHELPADFVADVPGGSFRLTNP